MVGGAGARLLRPEALPPEQEAAIGYPACVSPRLVSLEKLSSTNRAGTPGYAPDRLNLVPGPGPGA
jgi:hypothetical protein